MNRVGIAQEWIVDENRRCHKLAPSVRPRVGILSEIGSRVENRRSDCSLPVDIWLGFRRATSVRFGLVLFPVPAHRTGQAELPHPALGKDSRCSV